jgi:hypothetical protein
MGTVTASVTATVPAAPDTVTAFLADLTARPRILTDNYTAVSVEAGDVLAYHFSAGGRERDYRLQSAASAATITERDEASSFVNT